MTSGSPLRSCILVLGMHRSGTSSVCGLLSQLGAERPVREMWASPENPKGYFEPLEIVSIHDRLLASAGSSWHDWDPFPRSWYQSSAYPQFFQQLLTAAREDYPGGGPFLLKDPRVCRFVDLWLAILREMDCEPVVLYQYREAYEVASSLKARDGFTLAQGLLLWLRHALDAEHASRGLDRTFVSYESMMLDWQSELAPIVARVSPKLPRTSALAKLEAEEFIDSSLRHHRKPRTMRLDGAPWVERASKALERLRLDPQDGEAMESLDAIRGEFDQACAVFSPMWHGLRSRNGVLEQENAAAAGAISSHQNTIGALTIRVDRVAGLETEVAMLQAETVSARAEIEQVHAIRAELDAAHRLSATLSSQAERVPILEAELAETRGRVGELVPQAQRVATLETELAEARSLISTLGAQVEQARAFLAELLDRQGRPVAGLSDHEPIPRSEVDIDAGRQALAAQRCAMERASTMRDELQKAQTEISEIKNSLAVARSELSARSGSRLRNLTKRFL